MRKTRHIVPLALAAGLLVSCTATQHRLKRVRISQPRTSEAVTDTGYRPPQQITWTDDKGEQHIVTEAARDSVTGEYITQMELAEITVVARSKQVAERNGKINLDFVVTVPGELINNKWQLQLTPVAYKPSDTLYLDRIFLSGADFAKMQKKGYMRYQAFMNSIIPDSLYLQRLFDEKGCRKALADLEEEYFQAWKHEVIQKERWIDWSDKTNARFALFNYKMERNRRPLPDTTPSWNIFPPTGCAGKWTGSTSLPNGGCLRTADTRSVPGASHRRIRPPLRNVSPTTRKWPRTGKGRSRPTRCTRSM